MKVSELGEFGLIDILAGMVTDAGRTAPEAGKGLVIGIGDDAAVWHTGDALQLATTDLLIEDVHFRLSFTPWEELGWRAMAANLSDIAAMGGLPRYALVSLALPGTADVDHIRSLYRGMIDLAGQYGAVIAGGDVSSAAKVVLSITVFGESGSEKQVLARSAARPGDRIAVTGSLGGSAGGLEMMEKNLAFDSESTDALRQAFFRPVPRVDEGQLLIKNGVRAAIDISDGLLSDLGHICQISKVSARVEMDKVPVNPAVQACFREKAPGMALAGGEDYELLFTAGAEIIEKVKKEACLPVTVVGEIIEGESGEISLFDSAGNPVSLPGKGWDHFPNS